MKKITDVLKIIYCLLLVIFYLLVAFAIIKICKLFTSWFIISAFIIFSLIVVLLFIVSNKTFKHHKYLVLTGFVALAFIGIALDINLNEDSLNFTCSMYHNELDFNAWWTEYNNSYLKYNISKTEFESFPMVNGISKIQGYFSDIKPEEVQIGDIVSYEPDGHDFFIAHRVVHINRTSGSINFTLMGDNGQVVSHIEQEQVTGKYVYSPALNFISKDQCRQKSFVVYCQDSFINQGVTGNLELSVCCSQTNKMECVYDYAFQAKEVTACRYITNYWLRVACERQASK